jgi:hypothetical protein
MTYDSEADTLRHIRRVNELLILVAVDLLSRGRVHDQSKLGPEEKPLFDELTPRLKELTYGSEEYKASLAALGPALKHHYAANTHHPEHYENGIHGMDLMDVVEMFCDWKAASERTKGGDFEGSLEYNQGRFGISMQLHNIFQNTCKRLRW